MFEDQELFQYIDSDDRQGYIEHCLVSKLTAVGKVPTRSVASGWFNLHQTLSATDGDIWIHREKAHLWWTVSDNRPIRIQLEQMPDPDGAREVYVFRKGAKPWSNQNRRGNRLDWSGLHAKARDFLFTERTFQELSPDNAAYAEALVLGNDLTPWHSLTTWRRKADASGRSPALVFAARQRAIMRMAMTARETVSASGEEINRTSKTKRLSFGTPQEFEGYLASLIDRQDGRCALTGIQLHYDDQGADSELLCSLDRIDSDGHYEAGNLQVVCRFVNRWKGSSRDSEFRRLVDLLRNEEHHAEV